MNRFVLLLILMLFSTHAIATAPQELHVSAPKSLKGALLEISELFEKKNPALKVKLRIGKSAELGRLIAQGTNPDVFLVNDEKTLQNLRQKKLVKNVDRFLADDLVVIGATNSKLAITDPSKLAFPELKAVALFGDKHPIGKTARAYLKKTNLYETVITKVAPQKNTKEVIRKVEAGEVDWAIVYASDIVNSKGIKVLWKIPDKDITPEIYYLGSVTKSANPEGARLYIETLNSTIAIKIFENAGLRVIRKAN